MASRKSLRDFLIHAKSTLHSALQTSRPYPPHLTFVIGNESADLDSLTSTLLFAYIRTYTSPPKPPYLPIIIPLSNLPASDISLRPELSALLSHTSIESSHLITLDDLSTSHVSLEKVLVPDRTRWILVDHNAMTGVLGSIYGERVVGVIDHHEDEGKVPKDCGDEPRIIEKSGSCASLVTNFLEKPWTELSERNTKHHEPHKKCDAELAKVAMASILIDTNNMKDSSKVTSHDNEAMSYLKSKVPNFDQDSFFEEIKDAIEDIGKLKLEDILRKDYKEWDAGDMKLGIGVVVKPMEFLIDKAGTESKGDAKKCFLNAVHQFAQSRKLDVVSVMTAFTAENGNFSRQLLVWATNPQASDSVSKFEKNSSKELDLKPDSIQFEEKDVKIWQQLAVQHSRKRVAPLLRDAMGS